MSLAQVNLLNPPRLDKIAVKRSFNRAAPAYDKQGVLQAEILKRLLGRLDYIKHQPSTILDLGCGTGGGIAGLKRCYPRSQIIGLDLAGEMLKLANRQFGWFHQKRLVNADMEQLPFAPNSFDLLFSNLALQWANDLPAMFKALVEVGRQGSLFMFTTFGPGTLQQLSQSWAELDQQPHVHQFIDMHDVGDALMAANFQQPVIDSETIHLQYDDFRSLLDDLKNIGAANADNSRRKGLMTPTRLRGLEQSYRSYGFENGKFVATYEVVYGHAWLK